MNHLDLNLLATLDLLLAEESVSRTAVRLGLSQAAVSAQLARLREHFNDDLLVARGRGLVKTPFAAGMATMVANCVRQAHAIAGTRGTFDPATASREFRVRAGDIDTFLLLAGVNRRLQVEAPGIGLQISGARTTLDFRIGPLGLHDSSLAHEPLYVDEYCVLADRDHPGLGDRLAPEDYLAARHVVRHFGNDSSPSWEAVLMRQRGHVRHVATVVDSYASIPYFLIGTRHLSTVPYRFACEMASRFPLRVLPLPIEVPRQTIVLQWSGHLDNDPGAIWLRALMRAVADGIYGGLSAGLHTDARVPRQAAG
jgi:DNA-binding transcriptional LysR family regulator